MSVNAPATVQAKVCWPAPSTLRVSASEIIAYFTTSTITPFVPVISCQAVPWELCATNIITYILQVLMPLWAKVAVMSQWVMWCAIDIMTYITASVDAFVSQGRSNVNVQSRRVMYYWHHNLPYSKCQSLCKPMFAAVAVMSSWAVPWWRYATDIINYITANADAFLSQGLLLLQ